MVPLAWAMLITGAVSVPPVDRGSPLTVTPVTVPLPLLLKMVQSVPAR